MWFAEPRGASARKRDKNEGDRRCGMKVWRRSALVAMALAGATILSNPKAASADDDPAVISADGEFVKAAAKSDPAALGKLLDADFVWIAADGKLKNRAQVL